MDHRTLPRGGDPDAEEAEADAEVLFWPVADDREASDVRAHPHSGGRLPDFLVIGAPKAGTTSLASWLRDHPDVFVPMRKELHFFDRPRFDDPRWQRWYQRQFADCPEPVVGEATPSYLHTPVAAPRMASLVPDARLIALLRNPVDRAVSHYWYARSMNHESRDLDDALFAGDDSPGLPYMGAGRYLDNIERLLEYFPREALLVRLFEDVTDAPATLFRDVCEFLGVDATVVPENVGQAFNTHYRVRAPWVRRLMMRKSLYERWPKVAYRVDDLLKAPAEYPRLTDDQRRRLADRFAEDNRRLEAWLGRELPGWTAT
jgi:hypothetical protein